MQCYYVHVKLLSGEVIPFEYKDKDNYKIKNLQVDVASYLKVEPPQISFYYNYILVDLETLVSKDVSDVSDIYDVYDVFIKDLTVKIYFDRTIRIHHEYSKMPKRAMLEIVNLTDKAYRYIYNELDYVSRGEGDFLVNQYYFARDYNYNDYNDDQLLINLLSKYNLKPFPDEQDFRNIEESTKINLISAYLFECVSIYLDIDSYVFINL